MAEGKWFVLRIDASVLEAAQRWANDELRSVNAQIEFVLREALKRAGRSPQVPGEPGGTGAPPAPPAPGEPDLPTGPASPPEGDPAPGD
jgi:hypothetical protein